jgi:hypothetical protein
MPRSVSGRPWFSPDRPTGTSKPPTSRSARCERSWKPQDVSEAAKAARVAEFADFDGMRFMCKLGVEPANDRYKAKNILGEVITPDRKEWHPIEQQPKSAEAKKKGGADNTPAPIIKPAWAKKAS